MGKGCTIQLFRPRKEFLSPSVLTECGENRKGSGLDQLISFFSHEKPLLEVRFARQGVKVTKILRGLTPGQHHYGVLCVVLHGDRAFMGDTIEKGAFSLYFSYFPNRLNIFDK